MNILGFNISESNESNDHQVRILIDRKDWLGENYLGMDPPALFSQAALISGGNAVVGRCNCGCEGCDDVVVDIEITEHSVIWRSDNGLMLEFVLNQYLRTIEKQKNDYSWEDLNRTAERLVSEVFEGKELKGNYVFKWASARIEKGLVKLSFEGGYDQKLFAIPWDSKDPETAQSAALKAVNEINYFE